MTLESVQFKVAGKDHGEAIKAGQAFTIRLNTAELVNGRVVLTAVAKDTVGNIKTSAPVAVTVTNAAPTIHITSPAAADITGVYFALTAEVTVGAGMSVKSVQFLVDDSPAGGHLTEAPYTVHDYQFSIGGHMITARVTDSGGNSAVDELEVDVTAP